MRRLSPFVAIVLMYGARLAYGVDGQPRRARAVAITPPFVAAGAVGTITASPSTITFTATDPDLGSVSGSSPATVSWTVSGGNNNNNWTLTVQAVGTSFSGCGTVPASAVTVACSSATVSGGSGTGVCSGAFQLSTVPQQAAGGNEGNGSRSYTATLNYTLVDSWRRVAALSPPCTLTLTYTVNAP